MDSGLVLTQIELLHLPSKSEAIHGYGQSEASRSDLLSILPSMDRRISLGIYRTAVIRNLGLDCKNGNFVLEGYPSCSLNSWLIISPCQELAFSAVSPCRVYTRAAPHMSLVPTPYDELDLSHRRSVGLPDPLVPLSCHSRYLTILEHSMVPLSGLGIRVGLLSFSLSLFMQSLMSDLCSGCAPCGSHS